jgi:hypothetical protein
MTMLRKSLPLFLSLAVFAVAEADTLLIEGVQEAQATRSDRPASGLTKAEVEARFGAPTRMIAAIGDPPISRWEYPSFTVYFEFERVIHAVARH